MVTYAVAEQDGQQDGHAHRAERRAPPRAVLGGLLELERASGERVPRQGSGGRGVHGAGRHGVARGRGAEERSRTCACLKEEVPGGGGRGERRVGGEQK